jgi:hypothetical protein
MRTKWTDLSKFLFAKTLKFFKRFLFSFYYFTFFSNLIEFLMGQSQSMKFIQMLNQFFIRLIGSIAFVAFVINFRKLFRNFKYLESILSLSILIIFFQLFLGRSEFFLTFKIYRFYIFLAFNLPQFS